MQNLHGYCAGCAEVARRLDVLETAVKEDRALRDRCQTALSNSIGRVDCAAEDEIERLRIRLDDLEAAFAVSDLIAPPAAPAQAPVLLDQAAAVSDQEGR